MACIAAGLAGMLIAAPLATAAEPAADEYTLDFPGGRDAQLAAPAPAQPNAGAPSERDGVAGETPATTPSPLDSVASAVVSAPVAAAAALLLTLTFALVAGTRQPRIR